jgi:hypothetical protein
MIPHGVLKNWHPMIGCDWHIPWPPGSPAPAPAAAPYFTMQIMAGYQITAQIAEDHLSDHWGLTMLKVTDIGPLIGHVGTPSVLLAIEIPLSFSKSYFGSSRYVSKGKPVAAALLWHVNPNLDCGMPYPTPTGGVIALTTHQVDMSWGDIISGALQMGVDFLIMWGLNKMMGKVNSKAFRYLQQKIFSRIAGPLEQKFMQEAAEKGWDLGVRRAAAGVEAAVATEALLKAKEKMINWVSTGVLTVAGGFITAPGGVDVATIGTYGEYSEDHPSIGVQKGDKRMGPGGVAGGLGATQAERLGQGVGKYLDGGNPQGYPKDIGAQGVTD